MAKDLEYYLAEARKIAEHREQDAEKEIRKLYKKMLKDLQTFISDTYVEYAEDDKLTYAMLQKAGYDARFLEEVEKQLNVGTRKEAKVLKKLVEDTYEAAYNQMVKGVTQSHSVTLDDNFVESVNITPDQIKRAVENPVSGLTLSDTLEKHRKEIIYNIKQTIGVGLMNGDRYTTMAKRIAEHLDGDYKKAVRIARTEAHRTIEGGNIDAAVQVQEELKNGTTGLRLVKTWRSMQDERVRPQIRRKKGGKWTTTMGNGANHMKMDGQIRLAEELFDLGGGVTAMAPGLSGDAGNDINCRCYASYKSMTDEQYFKLTGKHFEIAEPSLDKIADQIGTYTGGGYASIKDAVDPDVYKYIKEHTEATTGLYRIEEVRFTAQHLEPGDTFSFDGDMRSFSKGTNVIRESMEEDIFDEPIVFKTVGKVQAFDASKYSEYDIVTGQSQKEMFAGGRWEVVDIKIERIDGNFMSVIEIKQVDAGKKQVAKATTQVMQKASHVPFNLDEPHTYARNGALNTNRTKAEYEKLKRQLEKDGGKLLSDREVKDMVDAMDYFFGGDYTDIIAAQQNFGGVFRGYSSHMSAALKNKAAKAAVDADKFLDTASKYNGTAYRGMAWDIGGYADDGAWRKLTADLNVGDTIEFGNITSWTKKESWLGHIWDARTGYDEEATGQVWLELVVDGSKSGVDVSDVYKLNPSQHEVTFGSKAGFKVTKIEKKFMQDDDYEDGITKYIIHVEEV